MECSRNEGISDIQLVSAGLPFNLLDLAFEVLELCNLVLNCTVFGILCRLCDTPFLGVGCSLGYLLCLYAKVFKKLASLGICDKREGKMPARGKKFKKQRRLANLSAR